MLSFIRGKMVAQTGGVSFPKEPINGRNQISPVWKELKGVLSLATSKRSAPRIRIRVAISAKQSHSQDEFAYFLCTFSGTRNAIRGGQKTNSEECRTENEKRRREINKNKKEEHGRRRTAKIK
ncbi:hypothetical protein CEXT_431011 [Caerostris extrusa]|uniref:Uncharacterized protein n=1 Tax=Caerostris extrusa TaxID=172846 RepID=A0AAV4X0H3_CAEEX|nr:hypothetical protein CEXT_431011 [Caerostris extrusa]